ncbi:MAG: Teichoic acid translocation permease protein TagG [Spirochaetes bacterium ADurb.Bin001]|nr:MAG: Teichoic acid translocation permease protein TagG [Spirochaetes bacterium ADurb.Bin001]
MSNGNKLLSSSASRYTTNSSKANGVDESWDVTINAQKSLFHFDFKELFQYKDLIKLLIRRDFVSVYKQTIFGPLWFVFQPLMSTLIYMFVFGNIAQLGTDGIPQPLFYFSGTMLWTFFATNLQKSSDTFVNNAGLFGKVYFPRFALPISYMVNALFTLGIQFACMMVFYVYYLATGYHFVPTAWILATPLYIIQLAMLGMGFGLLTSALTTKYHDLRNLVNFGLSILMYATPVVYPISNVPEKWKLLFQINPITPVIEMFRFSFLGNGNHDIHIWLYSLVASFIVFWIGLATFTYNEKTFIDVI